MGENRDRGDCAAPFLHVIKISVENHYSKHMFLTWPNSVYNSGNEANKIDLSIPIYPSILHLAKLMELAHLESLHYSFLIII